MAGRVGHLQHCLDGGQPPRSPASHRTSGNAYSLHGPLGPDLIVLMRKNLGFTSLISTCPAAGSSWHLIYVARSQSSGRVRYKIIGYIGLHCSFHIRLHSPSGPILGYKFYGPQPEYKPEVPMPWALAGVPMSIGQSSQVMHICITIR
jgi:hypothetical protein